MVNLGGTVLTQHEVFAAQPAREMLSDNHWIVPTIAGTYRVNKPPTMGWLIAASMSIFRSDAEWVARLPAVLSGVATAVLIASLTARYLGREASLLAGLLTATSHYVLLQARLSEADMPMAMCVVLAYWAIAPCVGGDGMSRRNPKPETRNPNQTRSSNSEPSPAEIRRRSFGVDSDFGFRISGVSVLFYFAAGASFLLKGVGIAFILPACIAYAIIARDRRAGRILWNPVGLVVFALMFFTWPILAWKTHPQIVDAWHREVVDRVTGELNEAVSKIDPWYYYGWAIPVMLLPWLPLVVVGAVAGIRRGWHRSKIGILLLCWFICGFVVLNISVWKHKHYAMSILPATAPAAAAGLILWVRFNHAQKRPRPVLVGSLFVVGCAVAAGLVARTRPVGWADMVGLIGVLAVGGVVAIVLEHWKRRTAQLSAMFATAWLVAAGLFWRIAPQYDGYRGLAEFAARVNQVVPADATITLVDMGEHPMTYYLHRRMERFDDPEKAKRNLASAWWRNPPMYYVIAPREFLEGWLAHAPDLQPNVRRLDQLTELRRRQTEARREILFTFTDRRLAPDQSR